MKFIIPFAAACCLAVQIQPRDSMQKSIIGFLFEGSDFGQLWMGLSAEDRIAIKNDVFDMALTEAGYNPQDFLPDRIFSKTV